ncbi:OadG family protein [Arcobacter porcinus]|uniref:OAD_gamma domain-containing protein n=1 Tax=Arcobacter porcinus TaxID=1935204 RepID=A0A1C0AWQ4_9BACT|nr:OadG family protein [Arcobacter porcinus]OCL97162.1 hypothetical protein AAX27_00064 [Aliarcobacter thereius]OCL84074.1 hypothetical protein AAW30_00442 [Arcobacter porcinus]OCL84596.1 hypothetical protein AAW29_00269 [Arcobacter porcinus]OCL89138.1 hypothetical protein AAX30_00270 [Arcobacter porcinus]OCL91558.1 hypothetical protein AAX28_01298 [Arcobacter porcinus]
MLTLLENFFIVMGIVSTAIFVVGFIFKAKGVTFVEFFPKKDNAPVQNIVYNNTITQSPQNSYGIDSRKVAAIMAAIKYHNEK